MGDDQEYERGYDDLFNDGLFAVSVRTTQRGRPHMWPKSASEMRSHTTYTEQKMTDGYGDGDWYSNYMLRRGPVPARGAASAGPDFWQGSGNPRGGGQPGGYWHHQPYGPPVWIASGPY